MLVASESCGGMMGSKHIIVMQEIMIEKRTWDDVSHTSSRVAELRRESLQVVLKERDVQWVRSAEIGASNLSRVYQVNSKTYYWQYFNDNIAPF
jgi:hypothetical protein